MNLQARIGPDTDRTPFTTGPQEPRLCHNSDAGESRHRPEGGPPTYRFPADPVGW